MKQNYPIQDPATVLRKAYSLRELRLLAKLNDEEDDELDEYSLTNFKGEDFNYYSSSGNEYYDNNDPSPGDSILETSGCFPVETTSKAYHQHSIFLTPFINFVQLFR